MARIGVPLAAILACALLPAQEAPQHPVRLSLVAVDSRGSPVADLSASDLQVYDDGRPQQIASFRHTEPGNRRPAPPGPQEFSNRTDSATHATVILFDLLNDSLYERGPAWSELIGQLESLESSQGIYLYLLTMDGVLLPVHGLPEPERPAEAPQSEPWTRHIRQLLDQRMKALLTAEPVEIWFDERMRLTYSALELLTARMAAIPGHKNVVWITHRVLLNAQPNARDFIDYTPALRLLSEKLDGANVSIYPVYQLAAWLAAGGNLVPGNAGIGSQEMLPQIARYTGGRADATNRITDALQQAIAETRTGYEIVYYPAGVSRDGRFHKLKVTCTRPGVRIRTRDGYYAWPEQPLSEEGQAQALEAVASAPVESQEIGLRVTVTPQMGEAATLTVRVDAADLLLRREGGGYTGELKFVAAALRPDGSAPTSSVTTIHVHLTPAQHDDALKNGITFQQPVTAANWGKNLRLAVMDARSGALGSITIPAEAFAMPPGH
jgi:VWFA-related protein